MEIFIFIYFSSYLYKSWRSSVKLSAKYILRFCVCMYTQLLQSCPTLCNSTDCSPPGFSLHGILQARILVWVAMSSSRGSSQSRDQTCISCIAGRFFTAEQSGKPNSTKEMMPKQQITHPPPLACLNQLLLILCSWTSSLDRLL